MTGVRVRTGDAADLPMIMPVMRAAFDPRYGEAWTDIQCLGVLGVPGSRLLIAGDDTVVGFALSRVIVDECELMLLAVDPVVQGKGIGRTLLNEVIRDAKSAGAVAHFLEMRSDNTALRLYASAGFVEVGRRCNYYRGSNGQTFDAVTYRYPPA
jgi:[ribosomal protein S18]-alanine N-acetyltransferase